MPTLSSAVSSGSGSSGAALGVASGYLRDSNGSELVLSQQDYNKLVDHFTHEVNGGVTNLDLAKLQVSETDRLAAHTSRAVEEGVARLGGLVVECHRETTAQLNVVLSKIDETNHNVATVNSNVSSLAHALVKLQSEFAEYVKRDELANEIQRAETKIVQINQDLENKFGHNNELRRTAVGILQASDLSAVRADTILTRAEELCVSTPHYWLAPAIVVLAQWVQATRGGVIDLEGDQATRSDAASIQAIANMLNEAYVRDREKTALFFGLICRRANHIPEANEWFKNYLSFQKATAVDRTCIILINAYAAGIMGHGREEEEILSIMAGWVDELIADPQGRHEETLLNDWCNTFVLLYKSARPNAKTYQALPEFCSRSWPQMQESMQATYLHRELIAYLNEQLNLKDFDEDDLTVIDSMIGNLVTSFDGQELPLRREYEYQKLIVDLGGDASGAAMLRQVKDDMLTETKSFLSILSDASRDGNLTGASATTRALALRIQMPWIKKAYELAVKAYRDVTPSFIELEVGDFGAVTQDGSNEEAVIGQYVEHVNGLERDALEKSKTGTVETACLIGGGVALLIGLIIMFAGSFMVGFLLAIVGGFAGGWGLYRALNARKVQTRVRSEMELRRRNGVIVIRKIMQEVRDWRSEYREHEKLETDVLELMDEVLLDDASAASAFFNQV